ncbi:hypothetical protein GGS20DRAFT_345237 [Poronia punctata]|nr:hypothetical protein GGS20DRAFT_345237 [Poronia punctata]
MKTSTLFASIALPLVALARHQVPLQNHDPLEFAERILRDPSKEPQTPPGSFLSMLDANKLCDNESTLVLSVPEMGFLTFEEGKLYVRESSQLSVPVTWTVSAIENSEDEYRVYHTDPFGKQYYIYDNGGHLEVVTWESSAGRYKVRYTNDLKKPSLILSTSDRCITVRPGDEQVYLADNSPCTPITFKKAESSLSPDESGELGVVKPIKWYDPAESEDNPTCSATLTKYLDKYKSGELNGLMAMSRDELTAQGWPENRANFAAGLPYTIVAAAACGIACAAGSSYCNPCTGPGGIV